MDSAWIGVIGGIVGGVLGVSGAVAAQIIGGKNQLKAQETQLDGQLAASRQQWAEENRVRLRDERKALYVRYFSAVDDLPLGLVLLIDGAGVVVKPEQLGEFNDALDQIGLISDEIELSAGDDVRQKVRALQARLDRLGSQTFFGPFGDEERKSGIEWGNIIRKALDEFIEAARAEVA